ncbi:hypothetical protein BWI97_07100 [Siphonobacter sp. BAB-5405]|nr:hypothetical protein BWI97_07100 [Siphonobacter sp. BAB-5405]
MTNNEAAQPGAAFVVCTTKPGVVAKLQHFGTNDQAKAYVSGLPSDSIHTIVSRHIVFEIVHVINPSDDVSRDKLTKLLARMVEWYNLTQASSSSQSSNDKAKGH